jgi:dTDP-4-dehydrorhamnose reductase
MRILVIGGAGQLGGALVRRAEDRGDAVVATHLARRPAVRTALAEPLDVRNAAQLAALLAQHRPEVIVDTAAIHNVDYCETHAEEAMGVNARATEGLARMAAAIGARFVFVSTDFVFDGQGHPPYGEADPPHPQSVYARSKLEGERAALAASPRHLVVRPSVIYSWQARARRADSSGGKGLNFATWLVEEVRAGREVRIVDDQVASPTLADDLAGAILALVDAGEAGLFHTAGGTAIDRYAFSTKLVARLGLDVGRVHPVKTAQLSQKAPRPTNSALRSDRLTERTGYRMLELDAALDRFASEHASDAAPT